jgi:hypothetical protein
MVTEHPVLPREQKLSGTGARGVGQCVALGYEFEWFDLPDPAAAAQDRYRRCLAGYFPRNRTHHRDPQRMLAAIRSPTTNAQLLHRLADAATPVGPAPREFRATPGQATPAHCSTALSVRPAEVINYG